MLEDAMIREDAQEGKNNAGRASEKHCGSAKRLAQEDKL
jgi:hypothetical protein